MRKIILFFFLFLAICTSAQRPLIQEKNSTSDTYPDMDNEHAKVIIFALPNINPTFTIAQSRITPESIDTISGKVYYKFIFPVIKGSYYINATIAVYAKGFNPVTIQLNLEVNHSYTYEVRDPDPQIVECYAQLMREGMDLFISGKYTDARNKYLEINGCSKIDNEKEVARRIAIIDSINMWIRQAESFFVKSDFSNAMTYYQKILSYNREDNYIVGRFLQAKEGQINLCGTTYRMADNYFRQKDYKNALNYYKKVEANSCTESTAALEKIQWIINQTQCYHVLTYEYSKGIPIGLSTGNYRDRTSAGYFTLRLNGDVFEALRTKNDSTLRPELNVSFGWTIPIYKPVWIFFGPGYSGIGRYVDKGDKTKPDTVPEYTKWKFDIKNAISPEAGVVIKIPFGKAGIGIALRYTFQYRFALKKEDQNDFGTMKHIFGAGICF